MKTLLAALLMTTGIAQAAETIGLAGFGLCAENPAILANWYRNLDITLNEEDGVFSGMSGSKFPFYMTIHQVIEGDFICPVKSQGTGVSLFVENFDAFVAKLNNKGIKTTFPVVKNEYGCIAGYKDPENNNVSLFSLVTAEEDGSFTCH